MKKKYNCKCPKILIVDDNEFNIYTLQEILKICGENYTADYAQNGSLAIEACQKKAESPGCGD